MPKKQTSSGVYTSYMTLEEIQHALSIAEQRYVIRLLNNHLDHEAHRASGLIVPFHKHRGDVLVMGAYVKGMASCPHCFVAITAARKPSEETAYTVTCDYVTVPRREDEDQDADQAPPFQHCTGEYRIGG